MKLYLVRYYIHYFGPNIALDYCFNSIFILLVRNNFINYFKIVVILFSSIMSSQVAKVNYYYFCSTLLNILFLFAIGNIVFFFIQAYCDKYEDYSYYSFDWQADHIEINLILVLIIVGSTFLSLFLHAAINC